MSDAGVRLGAMSVMAGTLIALITVIAWFGAVRALWRRRDDGEPDPRFALLLAALGAFLALVHFVTKYPNDTLGPLKGAYLQFVAPVLCALFGVGVAWMWRRRARWRWRVPALAAMAAIALVAAYSIHARFPASSARTHNYGAPFFARHQEVTVVSPPVSQQLTGQRFFIVGGAGFIGSHFCDRLLAPDGRRRGRDRCTTTSRPGANGTSRTTRATRACASCAATSKTPPRWRRRWRATTS